MTLVNVNKFFQESGVPSSSTNDSITSGSSSFSSPLSFPPLHAPKERAANILATSIINQKIDACDEEMSEEDIQKSMISSDLSTIIYILSMFLGISLAMYQYISNARNNIRPLAIEQIGLLIGIIAICIGIMLQICRYFGLLDL